MTTPPGTVSILGLFTALVFGILLLLGAFGVPVPMLTDATSQASAASVSGTIVGTVRDENSDEPIEHVQVFLRDLAIGSLTDERGQYFLEHVPVGVHEVVAQRIGLGEMAREVDVADGTTVDIDFRLQQTAVELNPLLILETEPLVYVDGERVASLDVSGRVSPDEVERVEILKGDAAVPLYGEEARGGVVQVFTKQDAAPAPDEPREHPFDLPTFTPFSEPPRILNVDEVRAAMREAYPPELRADAIGGTVELWFYVTAEGRVGDYRIAAGSGHQALDDAALAVADVYRFSPALNRDESVPVWVTIPIAFLPSR